MPKTATTQVIPKSYHSGLFLKCGLFFAGGLLLTGLILYFSSHQPLGPSYEESFARLAQLKKEMLIKSIIIYSLVTALVLAGVVFISIIYSHRVVGPLVGIKRVIEAINNGDLTQSVRLRPKDAIKPMADALNTLIDTYSTTMKLVGQHAKTMQEMVDHPGAPARPAEVIAQAEAIKEALSSLQLR